ncbi:hypothetical protein JYU34_005242 [Plutella xylostella]|uniref:DNA repair protein RAD51 homolog 3 n=1 Tax=Plutella xylostella TaxID=51655 RepID=A0ABQ7QW68_PLUXY|nr:hypothetical protein JYU34_005242 [Plutella xylostella]
MLKVIMNTNYKIFNAAEYWQRETSLPSIPTFCQQVDKLLGSDGVQLGTITELLGLPGTGKTQMCLQLCASIQIPKALGGLEAEALYIDTNTNFRIHRYQEILKSCLLKCQKLLDTSEVIDEEEALKRLHYVGAFGVVEFGALMHMLPTYLRDRPKIRLVVIDSIAFPFKEGVSARERSGLLFRQMSELQRCAVERQIAVVLTNEMSTRLGLSGGSIVGSMGDAWSHRGTVRLLLSSTERGRAAVLVKSNVAGAGVASFQITKEGIRDVE